MSSRRTQFFMRRSETLEWLSEVMEKLSLSLMLEQVWRPTPERAIELASGPAITLTDGSDADRAFLATEVPSPEMLDPNKISLPDYGWVIVRLPREIGDVLLMGELSSKSDRYDPISHGIFESPASHRLLEKVRPSLLKRLNRPMWGVSEGRQGGTLYRTLGYSNGAAEWVRSGGVLKAIIPTENGGFVIEDPTTSSVTRRH